MLIMLTIFVIFCYSILNLCYLFFIFLYSDILTPLTVRQLRFLLFHSRKRPPCKCIIIITIITIIIIIIIIIIIVGIKGSFATWK